MQIQLDKESLLKPVSMVAGVVERRQTLPILSYILIRASDGAVSFTGTDLEVEMIARIEGGVEKSGEVTVSARKLFDICRALPDRAVASLTKQGDKVVLKAGKSRFSLSSLPSNEFPKVEGGAFDQTLLIPAGILKSVFERTAFCMAQQDVRYYLNGLYMQANANSLRAVATDGHRMAVTEATCEVAAGKLIEIIVPRKAVQEISRFLVNSSDVVKLEIGANHVRLAMSDVVFTSKLIDGKFPDYTKVIPSSQSKQIHLDRHLFREALGRVAILANEKYRGIRLGLEAGRLRVSAHNPEQEEAVEELETTYSGDPLEIGFNVNYLIDASNALQTEEVVLGLNDPNSSCTLRTSDSTDTQYIVMPMRL
jgi:DNA polymerase III subunit beta